MIKDRNPFADDEIDLKAKLSQRTFAINSGIAVEINDYGQGKRAVRKALNSLLCKPFEIRESKVDGSLWVKAKEDKCRVNFKKELLNQLTQLPPYEFNTIQMEPERVAYARTQLTAIAKDLGIKIRTKFSNKSGKFLVKLSNGEKNAHSVLMGLNNGHI